MKRKIEGWLCLALALQSVSGWGQRAEERSRALGLLSLMEGRLREADGSGRKLGADWSTRLRSLSLPRLSSLGWRRERRGGSVRKTGVPTFPFFSSGFISARQIPHTSQLGLREQLKNWIIRRYCQEHPENVMCLVYVLPFPVICQSIPPSSGF